MKFNVRPGIYSLRLTLPIRVTGRKKMFKFLKLFVRDERGVSAMEYAVLAGIVVLALGAMAGIFNTGVNRMFIRLFNDVTNVQDRGQGRLQR
jgi:pilus assembly protein Flp/PilA